MKLSKNTTITFKVSEQELKCIREAMEFYQNNCPQLTSSREPHIVDSIVNDLSMFAKENHL